MWPFTKPKEVAYGSPWEHRKELSYGYQADGEIVYPGLEPDWLGQFPKVADGQLEMAEPALGAGKAYAVTVYDGTEAQTVYTDNVPAIMVTEV
jgi:hypothetical protein